MAALKLEPYYRASTSRRPQAASANTRSSNLTNVGRKDVRAELSGLATDETAVVVADIPGNAIVVTRECYEDLLRRKGQ